MFRKGIAWLLCAVLLMMAVPFCALAEGEIDVTDVSVDSSSALWIVTWTSADDSVRLLSVQLSGATGGTAILPVLSCSACYAEVDGSAAPYGRSNVNLAFGNEMSAATVVLSGGTYMKTAQLQMKIALQESDDVFAVKVTDEDGNPVAGAPISVDIGGTVGAMTAVTDDYGGASFGIAGIEGGYTWTVHASGFATSDGVTYLEASASQTVGKATVATTEATVETSVTKATTEATEKKHQEDEPEENDDTVFTTRATSPQLPTLSAEETGDVGNVPTYEAVRGATTTVASETEVACNLSVDKSLLSLMKLKIGSFNKSGRLIVSQENYKTLSDLYGGAVVGSLTSSPYPAVTAEQIEKAKKGESTFAEASADKALSVTFGLALDFLLENGETLHVTDVSDSGENLMFDVQIPVPASMKKCKSFGVAMTGDETLTPLTPIKADKGTLSFRTAALGYYTLVGFTDGKAAATGRSPLRTLFIALIVAGALFLLACGFFTYWFFFRKKGKDLPPDNFDPEDDAYYDGETPSDEQDHAEGEAFLREVRGDYATAERDIFSSAEREREVRDPILSAREEVVRGGDDIFGLYSHRIDE